VLTLADSRQLEAAVGRKLLTRARAQAYDFRRMALIAGGQWVPWLI
jgi:hypothetical protein